MFALGPATASIGQVCTADQDQQFDSCTGEFYDSGGSVGNYGNNEDVTVTICPTGGTGAGPFTAVRFITWSVAGGPPPGDRLEIYNGTGTGGPTMAIGTNSSSLAGLTFTSSDASGCLTFRWRSDNGGTAPGWFARIVTTPWPGTNGSATVCSNGGSLSLFSLLGSSPDPGGSWNAPGGGAHGSTFNPASDPAGVYTYTQTGAAPCETASANVTITKVQAPNAGTNGTATFCSTGTPAPLINFLGGSPDAGGTWSGPGGPHSGTFNPASDPAGTYTYTVAGNAPCGSASATVIVTVNPAANAGTSGSISVCSNGAPFALIGVLGGSPQLTGAWTGPGGAPVSGTYTPGSSAPGVYTYTVPGLPPCPAAIATATVLQTTAPNAGLPNSITVCSDDAPFSMRGQLLGSPDAGGAWVGPQGAHGDLFNPASDPGGAYTYTVNGTGPCANASATLTITVRQRPSAGTNGSITLCSTDGSYTLFNALGGNPQVGGTWRDPSNAVHSGIFVPGTSAPGTYTYTVTGLPPCAPSSATVSVSVNTAPNAGGGASTTVCSNNSSFSLFALLTGSPDAGGSWTGPLGAHSGTFNPASDPSGAYTYTVAGLAPCANASATVNVTVNPAPQAGTNGSTTVCANAAAFALFDLLGGSPWTTGAWTAPGGGPSSGTFTPGTSAPGIYTYTVTGLAPCAPASSTVTVGVVAPPNPGTNGSVTVCSNDGPVNLFALLGGSPQAGGSWTAPGGGPHSGTYLPGSQVGGNYTYTVPGTPPCGPLSAVVQVNRVIAPNAGTNGTITVCSTNGPFDMLGVLGGNPNGTGFWLNSSNQSVSGTFTPGTTSAGTYTYVVPGTAPCVNDSAFVTVVVNQAPNAGANATIQVCSTDAAFPLFNVLGGTPNPGGSWTRPNGTPHSGTYTPGTSQPGGYTYTVQGLTPCLNATAVVTVSQTTRPNAGTNATVTRCSNAPSVNLFSVLGGNPQTGGTWSGPSSIPSGIFTPGTHLPGNYVYTVAGTAPCADSSATVTVVINQAPNAGDDGSITICQGTPSIDLFAVITGPYDLNGTWTEQGPPTGQLSGSIFNCGALPPGTYQFRYEVPGIGGCAADHAHATVVIVALLNAGTSGTLAACSSNSAVNLFNGLGGSPQPGGQWIDLSATGALNGQSFNATLVAAPGSYQFRYRLTGALSCSADSATVTVNVTLAANPGCNGTATFCSTTSQPQSLFAYLNCTPQAGGQWRRGSPSGPTFGGSYIPTVDNPGAFYYVFNQGPPCSTVWAMVTVSEVDGPSAGASNAVQKCSSDAPFNMTAALNGSPDPGGQWYFSNVPHSSTFTPGLDPQGVYEYRVDGQAPCAQASASLTVSVTTRANAGCNASTLVCSTAPQFQLFPLLTCNPDFGGFWLNPNLAPHPSGAYTPGTSLQGDYRYIVPGQAPCANDTAIVSVFETPSPFAGCSGNAAFCAVPGNPGVPLINYLGCSPDPFGTWVGPAPGNPPFSGLFVPGVSAPGTYTYTVSVPGCGSSSATVIVQVNAPANAGCNTTIAKCSTDGAFSMTAALGCSPALGGVWRGPLPSTATMDGVFFPGVTAPGTYRYAVPGTGACPVATAELTVNVTQHLEAGTNNGLSLCRTAGSTPLFPLLGSSAQPGGSWFYNSTTPHSGVLQPAVALAGNYVYRHAANGPCAADSATIAVQLFNQPRAGCGNLLEVCSSSGNISLFGSLGCSPELNGSWFYPNGAPSTGIFNPASDPSGAYKYKVPGNAGCGADSTYVNVLVYPAVDAGDNNTYAVCSNWPQFQLFNQLLGTPQAGGTWYDPLGAVHSGTYTPGTSLPGAYKYKLVGPGPCASDSAFVTVAESPRPDAGITSIGPLCSSQGPVALLSLLAGTPHANGTWTFNNTEVPPFINPAVDPQGIYTYTVQGIPPCANASASVSVTITQQALAGSGGTITACEGASAIPLVNGLSGTVTPGGSWTNNCGIGSIANGIYDASALAVGGTCTFTYQHAANGPCPATSATVSLTVVGALDAGDDAQLQVCRGNLVDLFASLGGTPQSGGIWLNADNAPGFNPAGLFATGQAAAGTIWHFNYILPTLPQCEGDTARLTVEVINGPFAGNNGGISVCANSAPINLGTGLSGSPDAGGAWYNTSTWSIVPNGIFLPSAGSGVFAYVVSGSGLCPADTALVTATVTQPPNAGDDTGLAICSIDAPVALFGLLGPNAQTGGTWTFTPQGGGSPVPHSGTYNPAVDAPGTYRYRVLGTPPCPNATANITVTEPQVPNAGCDATVPLCSNGSAVLMRTLLGCDAQPGGTWVYVTGGDTPHGPIFNPAVDPPGVYRYTIIGEAPCPNASALLTLFVNPATNAGQSTVVQACATQTSIDLLAALGPNAQAGGTWTDNSGSGALTGSIFNPSVAGNGNWGFTYTVTGLAPCLSSSANVTVQVGVGGSAGTDSSLSVCGNTTAFELFGALGGTPATGGTWSDPTGTGALGANGILNVSLLPIGGSSPYVYTINDPGCGPVSAVVQVTAAPFPVAGAGASLTVCTTSAPIDLFAQLTGNPDVDGAWTNPSGQAHGDSFIPGTHAPGNYTYTVAGEPPCPNASAVVSIAVNAPPNAGVDGATLACDTLQALSLITVLQGAPQTGGGWQDLSGSGGLTGGTLNTTGLQPGSYGYSYTVSVPGCPSASATATVNVVGGVQVDEVERECIERDRTYIVRFTISAGDAATYQVSGLQGAISASAPYVFTSAPLFTSQGFEAFVRDQYGCAEVRVAGESPCVFQNDVFVPESFSPNGDGVNEALIIPGIEGYPRNSIAIFNRWGAKLYAIDGYDNVSRVWDGGTEQGVAPAGTYFYVLDLGNGKEALTGFIYLNR
jgi:gliding motility-associated-like protein